jgi:hypothetical protein
MMANHQTQNTDDYLDYYNTTDRNTNNSSLYAEQIENEKDLASSSEFDSLTPENHHDVSENFS